MSGYDDIIDLLHYVAPGRKPMSRAARAAQFMPFKSLKGYDEIIEKSETELNALESHYSEEWWT